MKGWSQEVTDGKSEKDREKLKTSLSIGSSIFDTGWPQRGPI